MGGSFTIADAAVADVTADALIVDATVEEGRATRTVRVVVPLDGDPVPGMARTYPTLPPIAPRKLARAAAAPIDHFCRRCVLVRARTRAGPLMLSFARALNDPCPRPALHLRNSSG